MLSDECIRAGWETQRASMREYLVKHRKFNPRTVDKVITNFIESAVFAKLPCAREESVKAMFARHAMETR
jgi:hypothetical protein